MRHAADAVLFKSLLLRVWLVLAIALATAAPASAWAQDDADDDGTELDPGDDADDVPVSDPVVEPPDDDDGDDLPVSEPVPSDDDASDDDGDDVPVSQPAPTDDDASDDDAVDDDGDDAPGSEPGVTPPPSTDDDGAEVDRSDDIDDPRPNQAIVRLRPGVDGDAFAARYGVSVLRTIPAENIFLVSLVSGREDDDELAAIGADDDVEYAELNYTGQAPEGRPRFFFPSSEGIPRPIDAAGLPAELDLPARSCVAGAGITVGVLDTGVDANHPFLAASIEPNGVNMVDNTFDISDSGNGVDDDADGVVDEMVGHGTHVSGIVVQVAPDARILPVKVLDSDGVGDAFLVAAGIYYALEQGANVINLSLGSTHQSRVVTEAVEFATAQGVPVVAAAGNAGVERPEEYPAAADVTISVAATDGTGNKAEFSNFHPRVDLSAPGVDIASAYPENRYVTATGTSMAVPMVTGAFALLLGQDGALSPAVMLERLAGAADPIPATDAAWTGKVGAGRLNVGASIDCAPGG